LEALHFLLRSTILPIIAEDMNVTSSKFSSIFPSASSANSSSARPISAIAVSVRFSAR